MAFFYDTCLGIVWIVFWFFWKWRVWARFLLFENLKGLKRRKNRHFEFFRQHGFLRVLHHGKTNICFIVSEVAIARALRILTMQRREIAIVEAAKQRLPEFFAIFFVSHTWPDVLQPLAKIIPDWTNGSRRNTGFATQFRSGGSRAQCLTFTDCWIESNQKYKQMKMHRVSAVACFHEILPAWCRTFVGASDQQDLPGALLGGLNQLSISPGQRGIDIWNSRS